MKKLVRKTITQKRLLSLLLSQQGTNRLVVIKQVTEPRLTNEFHKLWNLVKEWTFEAELNFDYRKLLEDADSHEDISKRRWGKRLNNTPIIEHKNKYYLQCRITKTLKEIFRKGKRKYDKDEVEPYLYKDMRPISIRDISLSSIKQIKIKRTLFTIKDGR